MAYNDDQRAGLFELIGKSLGLDLTRMTLPIHFNEPESMLQKCMELYEYHDLLRLADENEDEYLRMLYVTVFVLSCFGNSQRLSKPFNPYLGETFEYFEEENDMKFVAEQTSHHPPISSCFLDTPFYTIEGDIGMKSKFKLNMLEIPVNGTVLIHLKRTDEYYYFDRDFTTHIQNLILGSLWLEHVGDLTILKQNSGIHSTIHLRKCGFFSKGWNEIQSSVIDEYESVVYDLTGNWTESIYVERKKKTHHEGNSQFKRGHRYKIFEVKVPEISERLAKWKLDKFCEKLLYLDDEMRSYLPETDSRLREDRLLLEEQKTVEAGNAKKEIEDRERRLRAEREEAGEEYHPRYFEESEFEGKTIWRYNYLYEDERAERISQSENNSPN